MLWLVAAAHAARPTDGVGLFHYDPTDVIATWDEPSGQLRVHYSTSGPNVTQLTDADANGVPDYVELAGLAGAEALTVYTAAGFRPPVRESELGPSLGGSDAFDLYLLDFGGVADGNTSYDRCSGGRCVAYLITENDFAESRYPSDLVALETVVPHELFHAVQAAYTEQLESWTSEGTATWAERLFRPDSQDFRDLAGLYLEEPTRAIDEVPVGPISGFAYGTSLWFDFLTTRHDPSLVVDLLERRSTATGGDLEVVLDVLDERGDDVTDMWTTFAQWNLATGSLAGAADSYEYATSIGPPPFEDEARHVEDDNRFYPLATTYYVVDHQGGPLWFGLEEPAPGVVFGLHRADEAGDVLPADLVFEGDDPLPRELDDYPPGLLYLWGSQAQDADDSIKVLFCAGPQAFVEGCFAPEVPTDTGGGEDTGGDDEKGCGCASPGTALADRTGALTGWLAAVAWLGRRRTRGSRRTPTAA